MIISNVSNESLKFPQVKHASRRNQLETLKDLKSKCLENPENELERLRTHEVFTPAIEKELDKGIFLF